MIKTIDGFPESIIALCASGRVTAADYDKVLIPKVESALKHHRKVRLYYEFGRDFSELDAGAAWKDFKIGVEHLSRWERMAVVTDVEWIRHAIDAFSFLMPGQLRVFASGQTAEARTWIEAP